MSIKNIIVRPIYKLEEAQFKKLLQEYHYLGFVPKIGETIQYVATHQDVWVSLIVFSTSALKCGVRDRWIGWSFQHQYWRLKLIVNNSRFLILPDWHKSNLGSHILSLCLKRLSNDWKSQHGHPILLVETFVDPTRFTGTVYKASNWDYIGNTKGFRRTSNGYSSDAGQVKMMFVNALHPKAKWILSQVVLDNNYSTGAPKMTLSATQMRSLPDYFKKITDPRRGQGKRHSLSTVLAISAGAILCGMRGYRAIHDWADNLGKKARKRFGCRHDQDGYKVPSESIIRDVLVRVDPLELDQALRAWNEAYAQDDESLAIDGKVMCNAINEDGHQIQIMSAVGHNTAICYTQRKIGALPVGNNSDEVKQTNEIKFAPLLLDAIDIENKNITSDALHTQTAFANYIVDERNAHYFFCVKGNQPTLLEDIVYYFSQNKREADYIDFEPGEHGRIETRKIWTTTALNDYLEFPHVAQVYMIQREFISKKTGKTTNEIAYGITSRSATEVDAKQISGIVRNHWSIENKCHYVIDWNYDEDRSRIRKGNGPENITRLRRYAIGLIKSKPIKSVSQKMRQFGFNVRVVFDYLKMTVNSQNAIA